MASEWELHLLVVMVTAPFVVAAMFCDAQKHRLPNKLVVIIAILSLSLHTVRAGSDGLASAGLGLLIGFGLLLPFYLCGMLGAGDVKFLAALGAMVTASWVLHAAMAGVVLAGVCSLMILLTSDRRQSADRLALIAVKASSLKMLTSDFASYESLEATRKNLPYGVCLGIGALGTYAYQIYQLTAGGAS